MAAIAQEAPKGKVWAYCSNPRCEGRWVRPCDAVRAKQCRKCHNREIAPKGFAATAARYGEKFPVMRQREYRLENPSNLEKIVSGWLEAWCVEYERERLFENCGKCYLLDFVVCRWLVVEVHGNWAHSFHAERDAQKMAALASSAFRVLELTEDEVLSGRGKEKLFSALVNLHNMEQSLQGVS